MGLKLSDLTPYDRVSYDDFKRQLEDLEKQVAAGTATSGSYEALRAEFVNWADDVGLSQEELGKYGDLVTMTSFDDLYTRWREAPFPPGSHRDDLDELHADLALVDTWVAETIVPYAERGVVTPPQVDVDACIKAIRDRALRFDRGATGEEQATLMRYIAYVDLIEQVFTAFRTEHADKFP
jgi:hypothetical protein